MFIMQIFTFLLTNNNKLKIYINKNKTYVIKRLIAVVVFLLGTTEERLSVMNAVKGIENVNMIYDFPEESAHDVFFDLVEIEEVPFGKPFAVTVNLEVNDSVFAMKILSSK